MNYQSVGQLPKRYREQVRRKLANPNESPLEREFRGELRLRGIEDAFHSQFPVRNPRTRRDWKIDFAIPGRRIAVECQGGVFMTGPSGHKGIGYCDDCTKYNHLAEGGWQLFFVIPKKGHPASPSAVADLLQTILTGIPNP